MATQNEPDPQKNTTSQPVPFVGELFRNDVEITGGEAVDPPILDMPGESGMLSEEEQQGLLQSGAPQAPKPKLVEPPILSLDFLDLESEDEK